MTLYWDDLNNITHEPCDAPGCNDDHATRYFHPQCHPNALEVSFTRGERFIRIGCRVCGKTIAAIAVATRPPKTEALVPIRFRQYHWPDNVLMPDQEIDRPVSVAAIASALAARGCIFESQCNPITNIVTLWCRSTRHSAVLAREEVPNGPGLPEALDRMVRRAKHDFDRLDTDLHPSTQEG